MGRPLFSQGRREACWEAELLARPHLLQTDPLQISAEVRPLHMLHQPRVRGTKLHSNKTESDFHDNMTIENKVSMKPPSCYVVKEHFGQKEGNCR